jgi:hypothetical protein
MSASRAGPHRSFAERRGGRKPVAAGHHRASRHRQHPAARPSRSTARARTFVPLGGIHLAQPGAEPQELVIAAPHQRFVASRVLWPRPEGSRVVGLATAEGRPIKPLASLGADTFALTVPPGDMTSYVLEVSATGLDSLSLWQRGAFHAVADRYAFFRGMVLGISILLGISFICLFIVRPQAVFPAAALFGWSAIAFLVIEAGYLPDHPGRVPGAAGSEQKVRALTEGLMLAGVIAMLVSFVELRRWMPLIGMALMASARCAVPRWRSTAGSNRAWPSGLPA